MSLSKRTAAMIRRELDAKISERAMLDREISLLRELLEVGEDGGVHPLTAQQSKKTRRKATGSETSPYAGLRGAVRDILRQSAGLTRKQVVEAMRSHGYPEAVEGASTGLDTRVSSELFTLKQKGECQRGKDGVYRARKIEK